jgi:hypothetical protein
MAGIVIGAGGPTDRLSILLVTKAGNRIPNEQRRPFHPDQVAASLRLWATERPNAKLRSKGSAGYNCVGLVFASRRTCVDTESVEWILREDGFRRLTGPEHIVVGDVVVYRRDGQISHVGWISTVDMGLGVRRVTVQSKWGFEAEYLHPLDHLPTAYGTPAEYWTDRHE